jgi:hypothetical protein
MNGMDHDDPLRSDGMAHHRWRTLGWYEYTLFLPWYNAVQCSSHVNDSNAHPQLLYYFFRFY